MEPEAVAAEPSGRLPVEHECCQLTSEVAPISHLKFPTLVNAGDLAAWSSGARPGASPSAVGLAI
jgi:hypothetical protein